MDPLLLWPVCDPVLGGGGGASPPKLLLSWLDFTPLVKIHPAAVLAHRFCFSIGRSWHQHIKDPHGNKRQ